eukprot:6358225-Ditylum_brightwellii.AAC.1
MNGTLKVIWNRHQVLVAEAQNMISPVQFGNCKDRTSLDALPLKIITMNCICLFCLNGTILNSNVESCYDCMIPEVTAMHLQSLELPENATKTSMLLNHNAQHFVKLQK